MITRTLLLVVMFVTTFVPAHEAFAQRSARQSIIVHGVRRTFVLRTPGATADSESRRPLVIALHGGGGNGENAEMMTGFTRLVASEGIVVAYPDGSGRARTRLLTWNAGECCGYAMDERVDDVAFIAALIDTLVRAQRVDPRRVYVTGMSNGAMMTHVLARELGTRIAAIAPVVGTIFAAETPAPAPVPALIINGMRDRNVPFEGGPSRGIGRNAWNSPASPAMRQGEFWARANGCDAGPARDSSGTVVRFVWRCPAGREVELYAITDGGHAWPGGQSGSRVGDTPSTALDATTLMWAFFKAHARN